MERRRHGQSGFGIVEILLIIVAVGVLVGGGWLVYQHNRTKVTDAQGGTQTTTQQTTTTTTTTTPAPTVTYLTIKEWGIKLPLSSAISDAYYVVPTGISNNADGKPSAIYIGFTSVNSSCGTITGQPTDYNSLLSIIRALPTDTDPVSGKLYTQLYPIGVTLGGYYYGYADAAIKSKTCASQTTLQSIDSAFASAVKGSVQATAN